MGNACLNVGRIAQLASNERAIKLRGGARRASLGNDAITQRIDSDSWIYESRMNVKNIVS